MTERSLLQRAQPARLALCFVTLVAALAGAALVTAAPAAALSPGCTFLIATGQGLHSASLSAPNFFEAGERLTFQAGPPTVGGTPTGMGITGAGLGSGTTIGPLFTAFPGTLVYDFPVTDFYIVQLFVSLTGLFPLSTWSVTCGPGEVPLREFGIPHVLLCSPTIAMRADGTMGHAFEVEFRGMEGQRVVHPCRCRPCPLLPGGRPRLLEPAGLHRRREEDGRARHGLRFAGLDRRGCRLPVLQEELAQREIVPQATGDNCPRSPVACPHQANTAFLRSRLCCIGRQSCARVVSVWFLPYELEPPTRDPACRESLSKRRPPTSRTSL